MKPNQLKVQQGNEPTPEQRLKAYILAGQDFMLAARCCEEVMQRAPKKTDELHYFLMLAVVICYACPFSGNRPYVALPSQCTEFRSKKQRAAHELAISMRHQIYAHTDAERRKVQIVPGPVDIYTDAKGKNPKFIPRFKMQTTWPVFPINKLASLQAALTFMRPKLHLEIETLRATVHKARGWPLTKFEIGNGD